MSKLTEFVELPSQGLLYNPTSSLSSGKVEIRYMTATEEDILTNINYIRNRTVIDKLLQSLIVAGPPRCKKLITHFFIIQIQDKQPGQSPSNIIIYIRFL